VSDGVSTSIWQQSCGGVPASTFFAARKALVAGGYVDVLTRGRTVPSLKGRELLQLQANSNHSRNGATPTLLQPPLSKGAGVGVLDLGVEPGDAWGEPA
jgi:hypothetical protein